jgi:hypothetical protein
MTESPVKIVIPHTPLIAFEFIHNVASVSLASTILTRIGFQKIKVLFYKGMDAGLKPGFW